MADARVTMAVADGVADVRLARPDKLNALDPATFAGLAAILAAESAEQAGLLGSAKQREAVRANLEDRAPVWD